MISQPSIIVPTESEQCYEWHMEQALIFRPQSLATIMKTTRLYNGLSVRAVARCAGMTHAQVLHLEKGNFGTRLSTFTRICLVLGLQPGQVLDDCLAPAEDLFIQAALKELQGQKTSVDFSKDEHDFLAKYIGYRASFAYYLASISSPQRVASSQDYTSSRLKLRFMAYSQQLRDTGHSIRGLIRDTLLTTPGHMLSALNLLQKAELGRIISTYRTGGAEAVPVSSFFDGSPVSIRTIQNISRASPPDWSHFYDQVGSRLS